MKWSGLPKNSFVRILVITISWPFLLHSYVVSRCENAKHWRFSGPGRRAQKSSAQRWEMGLPDRDPFHRPTLSSSSRSGARGACAPAQGERGGRCCLGLTGQGVLTGRPQLDVVGPGPSEPSPMEEHAYRPNSSWRNHAHRVQTWVDRRTRSHRDSTVMAVRYSNAVTRSIYYTIS